LLVGILGTLEHELEFVTLFSDQIKRFLMEPGSIMPVSTRDDGELVMAHSLMLRAITLGYVLVGGFTCGPPKPKPRGSVLSQVTHQMGLPGGV